MNLVESCIARLRTVYWKGWRPAMGWVVVIGAAHQLFARYWFHLGGGSVADLVAVLGAGGGLWWLRHNGKKAGTEQ